MRKPHYWLALFAVLALGACATAGSIYGPARSSPAGSIGYSEKALPSGAYQVSFVAPESTSPAAGQDYALLRAADLTLSKGHTWFQLLTTITQVVQFDAPRQAIRTTESNMTCNTQGSGASGVGAQGIGCSFSNQQNSIAGVQDATQGAYVRRSVTTIAVLMGDGAKPAGDHVYDAKETADRLRASMTKQ